MVLIILLVEDLTGVLTGFLGKVNLTTNEIEIVNYQTKEQFASDHFPVLAGITLKYNK